MSEPQKTETISKEQFERLCDDALDAAPQFLRQKRGDGDSKMDKESRALFALYNQTREKLGLERLSKPPETDFPTYAFALRNALYELLRERGRRPFDYRPIINDFLATALKKYK